MLRTDKLIYKIILIFNLICIAAGLVLCAVMADRATSLISWIPLALTALTLIFAGYYIISGYRKDAATYYKAYGLLFAVTEVVSLATATMHTDAFLTTLFHALLLSSVVAMTFSENLGKKKSFLFCGANLLLTVLIFAVALTNGDGMFAYGSCVLLLLLSVLYFVLTYAKYLDKTERGTK